MILAQGEDDQAANDGETFSNTRRCFVQSANFTKETKAAAQFKRTLWLNVEEDAIWWRLIAQQETGGAIYRNLKNC